MKRILLLIATILSFLNFSQATTVQGTIKKIDNFIVGAYLKPLGGTIAGTIVNFNLTFSLDASGNTNPATAPIPTFSTPLGAGIAVNVLPVEIISGRYVYAFILTGNASPAINWTANNEYLAFQLTFPSSALTIGKVVKLHDYTGDNGGNSGQALFDIGVQGFFYVDYSVMFYGVNAINSPGQNTNSSVDAPTPLPITLVSFKADKYQDRSSHLTWTTASETNSSYFNVQRSTDKQSWINVGKVNAAGNSQLIENYEFYDYNVYNGRDNHLTVYYRLQMVDLDNQSKTSPIASVVFGTGASTGRGFVAYPNPAADGLQVEWDGNSPDQPTTLEFFDIQGKLIYTQKVSDNTNQEYIDFSKTTIQPGLYMLRILNGETPLDYKQIVVGNR